ncbi:MAG: polyphosphate kinase 2 [Pseudomonadota bacterium]
MASKKRTSSKANQSDEASALAKAIAAFDIDTPKLADVIDNAVLIDGDYPYDKRMNRKEYEEELEALQIELLKLQRHFQSHGGRMVALFEGRDAAGKGGCIARVLEHLNQRHARAVALAKPTETERGQWYFQRYVSHLPTRGDMVLFDRSWYNRAGVERVMGFCTQEELAQFLREAPQFESLLIRDGINFYKFHLKIGRATQIKRFHDRRHDPLKTWKLSPIDLKAIPLWDAYTKAQEEMFYFTHTPASPWHVVRANDKRRARIGIIRTLLADQDYDGKDTSVATPPDPKIVSVGPFPGQFDATV